MTQVEQLLQQVFGDIPFAPQPDITAIRRFYTNNSYCLDAQGELIGLAACENEFEHLQLPTECSQLQYLNLSDNKKLHTLTFEAAMPHLWHLDVSDSGLSQFALPKGCYGLKYLDIARNGLETIALEGALPALDYLDLSGNQLETLHLDAEHLRYAYLRNNQLKDLVFQSVSICLEVLDLKNNQLQQLPSNFLAFTRLHTLYLAENPLSNIPLEVFERGNYHNAIAYVRSYLQSFLKSEKVFLHQAKMVLVGNGEVGKSSIRIKLLDKNARLPKKNERTQGLDIATYPIPNLATTLTKLDREVNFELKIWDFGGQGKYREVQQLFCSRKSLYLFVTAYDDKPSNEDYVGFEYWLSMINGYSFDEAEGKPSPVIHVVNKIDELDTPIDQAILRKQFPNVTRFKQISCKHLTNFSDFETAIRESLADISQDIFTNQYAADWLKVKETLEQQSSPPYISFQAYLDICQQCGLDVAEAKSWIKILDRIGTVIYLGEGTALSDYVILNPIWVKDGFYKVLDSRLFANGELRAAFLDYIWQAESPEARGILLALMKAYQLCYEQYDFAGELLYILPALLNDKPIPLPQKLQTPDAEVRFVFRPFMPAGTLNKLMVKLHTLIYNNIKWKSNVLLHDINTNTYGHIWENWEGKYIQLNLYGAELGNLYHTVWKVLEELKNNLLNTRYVTQLQMVVKANHQRAWYEPKTLALMVGEPHAFLSQTPHRAEEQLVQTKQSEKMQQPKVFVSYAHKVDSRYFKLFVEGIKTYSDWEIFDDRHILIGEDWHDRLQQEVQRCDFAIFLLSEPFFKSEYIRKNEFEQFIQRQAARGFPFFSVTLTDCNFTQWEAIAKRQIFVAHGQDYDLAKTHRDQQINFDLLTRFDRDGELIPNPFLNTFYRNFVEAVNKTIKTR